MNPHFFRSLVLFTFVIASQQMSQADEYDLRLRELISVNNLESIPAPSPARSELFDLGKSLFFDRELSGNRDVSCATCHHPSASSGDGRALPSGVGGHGLGPDRTQSPATEVVPRNAPDVFHRGNAEWTSMFWDSRASASNGEFRSPAGDQLPDGLENVLSVQAMFPVTSRAEMRGHAGDRDINGQLNEIALLRDDDFVGMWQALMNRLKAIPAYQTAMQQAFPDVPEDQLGFQHVANAIGEFEAIAFSPTDSAWDRYLAGDDGALSVAAKRGASHFLGGDCSSCHAGNLLTDQEHHNVGVPQLGPGKDIATRLDAGRSLETGETTDQFAFRTPALRNVTVTGPWMHNGVFSSLEDVIRHKYDPEQSLADYDTSQLPEHLQSTMQVEEATLSALMASLDPLLPTGQSITDEEVNDLMAFLSSLTSPTVDLVARLTPESVLSGLEVETLPPSEMDVLYDPSDGSLRLAGPETLSLDALFFRILDSEAAEAGFGFAQGMAPWAVEQAVVLSDTSDAQSYLDCRTNPLLFSAGDAIEMLLPMGLTADQISEHLIATYRVHGSPILWAADVASVPEPSALTLAFGMVAGLGLWRRRRGMLRIKATTDN